MVLRPSRGGAFTHVARLSSELSARGHEVAVCGPHQAQRHRLDVEFIPCEIVRPVSPLADARSLRELAGIVRRFRPDLIHAHGSKGGILARAARIASPRTPVIVTPHQFGFANYFAGRGQRIGYRLIERAMVPLASRILCVCEDEARLAGEIGAGRKARVVYNGIDLPRVGVPHPRVAALRERGPVVCAVAELHPRKGVTTLVEAMVGIHAGHPHAALVVAGEGEERDRIERLATELGLEQRVVLLGLVEDVTGVLAAADVFVNPAWAEAFPYAVLEAMAVGTPVVATDAGGTREAIENGVTGRLVPAREPQALAKAVSAVLADPEAGRALAVAAHARVQERFSYSGMIEGTLAVYREVGI